MTKQTKNQSLYNIRNVLLRTAMAWLLAVVVLAIITIGALWTIVLAVADAAKAAWRRLVMEVKDLLDWPWLNMLKLLVGR